MRILSFDTSTDKLELSLLEGSLPVLEQSVDLSASARKSTERQQIASLLVPLIDESMTSAGWTRQSLDLIVVGQGPGSFTGIRCGVVTARTLAQALNLPLMAVNLLEVFASCAPLPCAVVIPAGKGHLFVAAYQGQSESGVALNLQATFAPTYVSLPAVGSTLESAARWAVERPAEIPPDCLAGHEVVELPKVKNIATRQAQIAWNRLSLRGSTDIAGQSGSVASSAYPETELSGLSRERLLELFPYAKVQPLYLRSPSVTVKATVQPQHANENQADAPGRHR